MTIIVKGLDEVQVMIKTASKELIPLLKGTTGNWVEDVAESARTRARKIKGGGFIKPDELADSIEVSFHINDITMWIIEAGVRYACAVEYGWHDARTEEFHPAHPFMRPAVDSNILKLERKLTRAAESAFT